MLAPTINRPQNTVKPVSSGHPLFSGQSPKSQDLFPLLALNESFIKRTPLLSGRGHLKSTWNGHFYCYQPALIQFHHSTCQSPAMRKIASNCHLQIFRFLHWKNVTWRNYFISFYSTVLFSISFCLYRACFTHQGHPASIFGKYLFGRRFEI